MVKYEIRFLFRCRSFKILWCTTQGELFREYFMIRQEKYRRKVGYDAEYDIEREIATLFQFMFGIDVDNGDLTLVNFPTFEEVLGLIDLAVIRKQTFKNFERTL